MGVFLTRMAILGLQPFLQDYVSAGQDSPNNVTTGERSNSMLYL